MASKITSEKFLINLFTKEPRLAAAWDKNRYAPRGVPRGGNGWLRVKESMKSDKLNVEKFKKKQEIQKLAKILVAKDSISTGETLVYKYFEEGANIGIHSVEVVGPIKIITDSTMLAQKQTQKKFFTVATKKTLVI